MKQSGKIVRKAFSFLLSLTFAFSSVPVSLWADPAPTNDPAQNLLPGQSPEQNQQGNQANQAWVNRQNAVQRALSEPIGTREERFLADWNRDGVEDLVVIQKSATGSNSTEVHIYDGMPDERGEPFVRPLVHSGSAQHEVGENFKVSLADWNLDGVLDLVVIQKNATGSHSTEVHIYDGAPDEQGRRFFRAMVHSGSAHPEAGEDSEVLLADWNRDGVLDLVAVPGGAAGDSVPSVQVYSGSADGTGRLFQTSLSSESNPAPAFRIGAPLSMSVGRYLDTRVPNEISVATRYRPFAGELILHETSNRVDERTGVIQFTEITLRRVQGVALPEERTARTLRPGEEGYSQAIQRMVSDARQINEELLPGNSAHVVALRVLVQTGIARLEAIQARNPYLVLRSGGATPASVDSSTGTVSIFMHVENGSNAPISARLVAEVRRADANRSSVGRYQTDLKEITPERYISHAMIYPYLLLQIQGLPAADYVMNIWVEDSEGRRGEGILQNQPVGVHGAFMRFDPSQVIITNGVESGDPATFFASVGNRGDQNGMARLVAYVRPEGSDSSDTSVLRRYESNFYTVYASNVSAGSYNGVGHLRLEISDLAAGRYLVDIRVEGADGYLLGDILYRQSVEVAANPEPAFRIAAPLSSSRTLTVDTQTPDVITIIDRQTPRSGNLLLREVTETVNENSGVIRITTMERRLMPYGRVGRREQQARSQQTLRPGQNGYDAAITRMVNEARTMRDELMPSPQSAQDRAKIDTAVTRLQAIQTRPVMERDRYGNLTAYSVLTPDGTRRIRVELVFDRYASGPMRGKAEKLKDVKIKVIDARTGRVIQRQDLRDVSVLFEGPSSVTLDNVTRLTVTRDSKRAVFQVRDQYIAIEPARTHPVDGANTYILNLQDGRILASIDRDGPRTWDFTELNADQSRLFLVDVGDAFSSHSDVRPSRLLVYNLQTGALIREEMGIGNSGPETQFTTRGLQRMEAIAGGGVRFHYVNFGWSKYVRTIREYDSEGRLRVIEGLDADGPIQPYRQEYSPNFGLDVYPDNWSHSPGSGERYLVEKIGDVYQVSSPGTSHGTYPQPGSPVYRFDSAHQTVSVARYVSDSIVPVPGGSTHLGPTETFTRSGQPEQYRSALLDMKVQAQGAYDVLKNQSYKDSDGSKRAQIQQVLDAIARELN